MEYFIERNFFNFSTKDSSTPTESITIRVFMLFYLDHIFTFSSLTISTKILEKRTRSEGIDLLHALPSLDCTRRGSENGISFLHRAREPFHRRNPFFGTSKAGREQRFSIGVEERKRWIGDEKRVSNARALPRGGESRPPPSRPLSFSPGEKSPPRGDFLTLLPTSRLLSKESSLRKRVRLLRAFRRASTVPRPSREPSACAHTMFLFLLCTHKCPTENVNLPSERFSLAQYAPGWLSTLG